MDIVICEDNNKQRELLKNIIEMIVAKNDFNFKIRLVTGNPQDVINNIRENDIYFLDVDLNNKINGFKLAQYIRKKDIRGHIIFITTHSELTFLTFKYRVEAMDYILKDSKEELENRIGQCLTDIHKKYYSEESNSKMLSLKVDDRIINVKLKDIVFIETSSSSHKIIIHETNKYTEISGALKDIEKKLDKRFYRCHRAYVINKERIKEINIKDRIIYMDNGEECYASFRQIKGLIKNEL